MDNGETPNTKSSCHSICTFIPRISYCHPVRIIIKLSRTWNSTTGRFIRIAGGSRHRVYDCRLVAYAFPRTDYLYDNYVTNNPFELAWHFP